MLSTLTKSKIAKFLILIANPTLRQSIEIKTLFFIDMQLLHFKLPYVFFMYLL
jgi:hypothetical protein